MPSDDSTFDATPYADAIALLRDAVDGVIVVYLFGSTVRGPVHAESDVDLAVWADPERPPLDAETRWRLQHDLAKRLSVEHVDLVDLRQASTVMRAQVVHSGRVLFERDAQERSAFEMVVCSMYAHLNEERADILDDIRARGRVYE